MFYPLKHIAFSDLFGEVGVSRLQRGLMSDVIGILGHYLKTHSHECTTEPDENSTMSSADFKMALRNEVRVGGNVCFIKKAFQAI